MRLFAWVIERTWDYSRSRLSWRWRVRRRRFKRLSRGYAYSLDNWKRQIPVLTEYRTKNSKLPRSGSAKRSNSIFNVKKCLAILLVWGRQDVQVDLILRTSPLIPPHRSRLLPTRTIPMRRRRPFPLRRRVKVCSLAVNPRPQRCSIKYAMS